jgi:hypothetical protein
LAYNPNYARGYWWDTWKLLHIPRATIFYCNLLIGVFLAPNIRLIPTILVFIALFFGLQIVSYSIDELRGRKTNTNFTDKELKWRAILGSIIPISIGIYLSITISILFTPLIIIGTIGIIGYNNNDGRGTFGSLHSRIFFGVIWAVFPLVSMYVFESLSFPPVYVWFIAGFAGIFAIIHISTYGLFRCKSFKCLDLARAREDGLDSFPGKCHAQKCEIRRNSIPKEVHSLGRELTHLQDYSMIMLTGFIIFLHFGI